MGPPARICNQIDRFEDIYGACYTKPSLKCTEIVKTGELHFNTIEFDSSFDGRLQKWILT